MHDDDFSDFEAALAADISAKADAGQVALMVARRGGGEHEVLARAELTTLDGLVGDRWSRAKDPEAESQITLMQAGVVRAINAGALVATSGDNFQVGIDLSEAALPVGTRLQIGEALLEVTAEPHTGCKLFVQRFSLKAMRWVNGKERRHRRLRGVHCRVLKDGAVVPGDAILRGGEAARPR